MDLNASHIWTQQHTFLKPVLFSSGQVFNGASIKFSEQKRGSIAVCDGKQWNVLHPGASAQVLSIVNGQPLWSSVDTSVLNGVVKPENGGTGISNFESGSVLCADSKSTWSALKPGKDGNVLQIKDGTPTWDDFPGVSGVGKSSYLTVWSSTGSVCASNIQVSEKSLVLKGKNQSIQFGDAILHSTSKQVSLTLNQDSVVITKDTFAIQHDNKTVVKFYKGKFDVGVVPTERLDGVVATQNGGTGISRYNTGDIIYAVSSNQLGTLSIDNMDGFYLKVVNGRPQWAPLESGVVSAKTTNSSTMALSEGTYLRAPMQFQTGQLTSSPHPGALEWDGNDLYITTKDSTRKAVMFKGENSTGSASSLTRVLSLSMGGLGKAHDNARVGSILFVETNTNVGVLKPESGQFLRIDPHSNLPTWSHAVVEITPGNGVSVNRSNKYTPQIEVDTSDKFNPLWRGNHIFERGVVLGEETTLKIPKHINSGAAQIHFDKCKEPNQKTHGDVWFDNDLFMYVNGATVNLTETRRAASVAQIQHLRICEGVSPIPNSRRKVKYPLPFGGDGYSRVKWKFIRADLRVEDCPSEHDAKLQILVNNQPVLEQPMTVAMSQQATSTQLFTMPYAFSGDLIEIEYGDTGGSDCWSLFLTVVNDN